MADLHGLKPQCLHRDLKSGNALVDDRDNPTSARVCDFGLSRSLGGGLTSTAVLGTYAWSAPEILRGSRGSNGAAADVFSFGVLVWELMTSRRPWGQLRSPLEVVALVGYQRKRLPLAVPAAAPGLEQKVPWFDPVLERLHTACCAEVPAERPSFASIVHDLRARHQQLHQQQPLQASGALTSGSAAAAAAAVPVLL